jgi:hypothetical protein
MITMYNIPAEVYLVALDFMGQPRPANPAHACAALLSAEARCEYEPLSLNRGAGRPIPITAFAAALACYVSLSGPFSEEDGEFAGLNGWIEREGRRDD